MQVFSTVAALAFLASAVNALVITLPTSGTTVTNPVSILVENSEGETFPNVQVVFTSPCGSYTHVIPTGNKQSIYLPCEVTGPTNIVASVSQGSSASTQVIVNSALPPYGAACGCPCADPLLAGGCGPYAGGASPCFMPSALPPVVGALPGVFPCASPCGLPYGRLSRRSRRLPVYSNVPTATPCDNVYFNPPANMPLPDCARALPRCGRLYGEQASEIQPFNAESHQHGQTRQK